MTSHIIHSIKEVQEFLLKLTNEQLKKIYEEFLTRSYKPIDIQIKNCINEEIAKRYYKKLV
jgi:hypothetical protein